MLDLTSIKDAINSLRVALKVACDNEQIARMGSDVKDTVIAGVIQNFEFTYELCWKFMKRTLEADLGSAYVDGLNRRELFRLAAEHRLISEVERWMEYHDKRNETSHTYNKTTAKEVFEAATPFLKDAEELLSNLEKRNAP